MSLVLLLEELASRQIELRLEDGKLRYKAPEGALNSALRDRIGELKEALIAHLSGRSLPEPEISRFTPSQAQERLWFVHQLQGPSYNYNISFGFGLRGQLDSSALHAALDDMVRRHQSLRCCFVHERDTLYLEVHRDLRSPWAELDLSGFDAIERKARLAECINKSMKHCFDLSKAPLLLATLVKLGPMEHMLSLNIHHTVADGWSFGILLQELTEGYVARLAGRAPDLPALKWQYSDYVEWQEQLRLKGSMDADLAFWRERLTDAPVSCTMPTDLRRPPVQHFSGGSVHLEIDAQKTARLRARAREWSASLNHLTLAAMATVLADFSGSRDLIIGLPLANRTRRELEPIIGMFVNVVPLRLRLAPKLLPGELVAQVKRANTEAIEHCNLPFERLVKEIVSTRALGLTPLFQVVYNYLPPMKAQQSFGELEIDNLDTTTENQISKYDCTFYFDEYDGAIHGHIEYADKLYHRETVERWAQALLSVLDAMLDKPDTALDLSSNASRFRAEQIETWCSGAAVPLPNLSPWMRFETMAQSKPGLTAVEEAGVSISYVELAKRAGVISALLASQGVGKGDRVGLLLPRGSDYLAAMLGVVRRGAVFVPFDEAQPVERLVKMATRARLAAILCGPGNSVAHELAPAVIEVGPAAWDRKLVIPDPIHSSLEDPLYMIFTSGSTGTPKAVGIPWRGLCNIVQFYVRFFGLAPGERVSQISSTSFDANLFEIWPALLGGSTLVIVPEDLKLDPESLRDWLLSQRIAVHFSPTPLAEELMSLEWPSKAPLRLLSTGGQTLHRHPGRDLPFRVSNNYGPTEASISVSSVILEPSDDDSSLPSIGRVIDNTRLAILDESGQRVPVGVIGELFISGEGVALGYFDDPDSTAASFVSLPGETSERWYKTGDKVRLLPGGELEFIGRVDGQIKLRGYRIEAGEIENALLRIPGIRQAAVRLELDQLVAYIEADGQRISEEDIRGQIARALPAYMIPSHFVVLDRLPRQSSGKIDIKPLPFFKPASAPDHIPAKNVHPVSDLVTSISNAWARVLKHPAPGLHENFFDLGGHSMMLVRLKEQIRIETGREIGVLDLFRNPTIAKQTSFLEGRKAAKPEKHKKSNSSSSIEGIAIIGMSGRFPSAENIREFWKNLSAGRDCISLFSREELLSAGVPPNLVDSPDYVPANAILRDIDRFDADFFGIPAREAEMMDPQQRLLLEEAWHLFEDAAYDPAQIKGRVGVFVGSSLNGYLIENVLPRRDIMESLGGFAVMIGNDKDFAATRISYKLGLRGPSVSVNTACSTSLVAVHQAVTALRDGQCEVALAGGSCVRSRQIDGYSYEDGGVLSRDGKCRAFDAESTGMVGGNGVTLVLLKPLAAAVADNDHIYAVIKGIAINNDGSDKVGFTAPGIHGQSLVIRDALERADVDPQTVLYVETHGTATQLGDSIEVAALVDNYVSAEHTRTTPLLLGSVKTNIGHLDSAAGAAGLIKTALCLHERTLVPSLHFHKRNPQIQWPGEQIAVGTQTTGWKAPEGPLRAAVSSFGIGGTNAHAVLEEAPRRAASGGPESNSLCLLLLTGKNEKALQANAATLGDWLRTHSKARLRDVAQTLAFGRRHWDCRRAVCVAKREEAAEALVEQRPAVEKASGLAFMFTGMGTQKPGMARALYERAPRFRSCIDDCAGILQPVLGIDIRSLLLASPDDESVNALLNEHRIGQPAVFSLEYAQAMFWMDLGLSPSVLIGHSLGEWVAACVAGVFSVPDALRLVSLRGGLMDRQKKGSMLAVNLTEAELAARLPDGLDIATINAMDQIVVAGPEETVEAFALRLEQEQVRCKRLQVTLAAHSSLMEPALEPLRAAIAAVPRKAPNQNIAVLSNITGRFLEPVQLQNPEYWTEHLRRCVRFADGLGTLWERPGLALLECGPSHTLCNLALRDSRRNDVRVIVASSDGETDLDLEWRRVLESAGSLWTAGLPIDLEKLFALQGSGLRIPAPGYAFQRKHYWLDAASSSFAAPCPPAPPIEAIEEAPSALTTKASPLEQQVIAIMRELLGPAHLARNSDFFLSGGDSLLAVRLASRIGTVLGTRLTPAQIMKGRTPANIASILEADATGKKEDDGSDGCLMRLWKGNENLAPIILVHAVGGGAFIYSEFLESLATNHPVYGLQSPGLWDDTPPIDGMRKQAEHYHACLTKAGIHRPLMLGGSSYGGLVCYELDRLYRQAGHVPGLVVLFDSPGPGYMPERLESEAEICAYMLSRDSDNRNFTSDLTHMQSLDHQGRIAELRSRMRESFMPDATTDDVERHVRIFRQNLVNLWNWVPEPHQARLLFCKASTHSLLTAHNPELAWVPLALGGIEILPVPGDHASMLSFPHVEFLAKEVNRRLSAAQITL